MKNKVKRSVRQLLFLHFGIMAFIISLILIYDITNIGCPIRKLTGVPCPTCGMTRAGLSLLRLDFDAYFVYNPATVPVIVALWLGFHKQRFSNIKLIDFIIIGLAVFTFLVYIVRMFV